MPTAIVDGKEVPLPAGRKVNGIEAARLAGVEIPHYCWHPGLSVVASCRMCLVETGTRHAETGAITMLPKLVPACQTPAADNVVFVTDSEKVKQSRAMVEEALLIDHPIDCPICDKAGECLLQDYHFQHGQAERRADIRPFTSRRRPMGETVTLFVDRCVMCSRCVRFTREISGTAELMVVDRGSHAEIDVVPGYPLANKLSGNVVDLCPVGALGDTDFLYQQRVWFMRKHEQVCAGCSTGCSIYVEENQDQIYRLKPRTNEHVNGWWMCDEGRYGFDHVHSANRLVTLRHRSDKGTEILEWSDALPRIDADLRGAGRLAGIISPHLTVEEAYLMAKYLRSLDGAAILALGPVLTDGADEKFPSGFTIRAEKCPNRKGVEMVLAHFMGRVPTMADVVAAVEAGEVRGVWVSGGYRGEWIDAQASASLAGAKVLVVHDMFGSPLADAAHWQLPGPAFAEREGSYVNHAGRLQSFRWAVRPPAGVQTDGAAFWSLLAGPGLYKGRKVLEELAGAIAAFAPAAGEVDPLGVQLAGASNG